MVEWPTGCVPWFRDLRLIDNHTAFHVPDVNSMTDGSLFMGATTETWYVNGRCRFFMRILRTPQGIEVPATCHVQ